MQVKQVHATGGFKCKSCFLSLLADMTNDVRAQRMRTGTYGKEGASI